MKPLDNLIIFGAGLIGGSVAWAARRAGLATRIVAVDARPTPAAAHPFDEWLMGSDGEGIDRAVAASDLTVLALPVHSIVAELPRALRSRGVVTDCGSTKRAVAETAAALPGAERFVPGHPMAGLPVGGIEHARADLFEGRRWLLCPAGSAPSALAVVRGFVEALGAEAVELGAADHDRSVAITSHVPQVLASALAVLAERENALQAAGPGFDSATRVAGGAESMWKDIFETNGAEIGRALRLMAAELAETGRALEAGDALHALAVLAEARRAK